jgi:hypothetical protein
MAFGAVMPVGGAGGIAVGAWIAKAKGGSLRRFMERSAVLFLLTSSVNAATLALAGLLVGVGVLDGGLTGALILYGAAPASAAAAVLVYHAIVLWVPTLLGTIAFLRLRATIDEPLVLRGPRPLPRG